MDNYQDKKKTGGKINSKIDNQDSYASVLAIEQLRNPDIFGFGCDLVDFCVKCEGDEDIEIFNETEHIYIQVKSNSISKNDLLSILDDFLDIDAIETKTRNCFVITVFENLIVDNKKIIEHIKDYREVLNNKFETQDKKLRVKKNLVDAFGLAKYDSIIDRLVIAFRPLFIDCNDTMAIFAQTLRVYYPIKGLSVETIETLYQQLISSFSSARRNRSYVTSEEIEKLVGKVLSYLSPFSGLEMLVGYKKVENGYIKSNEALEKQNSIFGGFKKAKRDIMKGWRKKHIKEVLLSLIIGAKKCPKCGHPMMANIYGLNGIACPDCGFNPYVSMFAFCECGNYELIKSQPEMKSEIQIKYIREYILNRDTNVCKKCGKAWVDEYFESRIFYAPIPYPYDNLLDDDAMYKDSKY